jgi:hypothetical protein
MSNWTKFDKHDLRTFPPDMGRYDVCCGLIKATAVWFGGEFHTLTCSCCGESKPFGKVEYWKEPDFPEELLAKYEDPICSQLSQPL